MVQISCGGWRRPYSYYLGAVPEYQNCFAFVKVCCPCFKNVLWKCFLNWCSVQSLHTSCELTPGRTIVSTFADTGHQLKIRSCFLKFFIHSSMEEKCILCASLIQLVIHILRRAQVCGLRRGVKMEPCDLQGK